MLGPATGTKNTNKVPAFVELMAGRRVNIQPERLRVRVCTAHTSSGKEKKKKKNAHPESVD